jgi:maltose-binding protein MalE
MPMNWPRFCIPKAEVFAATLLLVLSGCQPRQSANNGRANVQEGEDAVLYVYVGVEDNAYDFNGYRRNFNEAFNRIEQQFRQVNPHTHFVVQLYRESALLNELSQRNATGLGPDLLLITNHTALKLAQAGLTRSPHLTPELRRVIDPATLRRTSLHNSNRLASLPVVQKAQLACFNRTRLQQVPTTVQELLAISASGNSVGLEVYPPGIFWSAGALGAIDALQQALLRRPLNPEQQRALVRWTRWLQDANTQQKVTFYSNQSALLEGLSSGTLDWISCHSTDLLRLQQRLGSKLGVAPLPDGPDGQASPISELTVLALGVNSSPGQRKAAEAFAHFALNPMVQRSITLSLKEVLPVNRFVNVPAESSMVLKAMLRAQQQSRQSESIVSLIRLNDQRMLKAQGLITRLVFGESTPEATAQGLIHTLQTQP